MFSHVYFGYEALCSLVFLCTFNTDYFSWFIKENSTSRPPASLWSLFIMHNGYSTRPPIFRSSLASVLKAPHTFLVRTKCHLSFMSYTTFLCAIIPVWRTMKLGVVVKGPFSGSDKCFYVLALHVARLQPICYSHVIGWGPLFHILFTHTRGRLTWLANSF